jgi:hypothetical protein
MKLDRSAIAVIAIVGSIVATGIWLLSSDLRNKHVDEPVTLKAPPGVADSQSFSGIEWFWSGPTSVWNGSTFVGHEYRCDIPNLRLIDVSRNGSYVQRIRAVQVDRGNGEWINHGLRQTFLSDGASEVLSYTDGFEHGERTAYYPDGKIKLVDHWLRGKQVGNAKGYSITGELEYDVEYDDGKESRVNYLAKKQ